MANHPSALKRARQAGKRAVRNTARKSEIKTLAKKLASAPKEGAASLVRLIQSRLDKASQRHTLHWKTAARRISRLSRIAAAK